MLSIAINRRNVLAPILFTYLPVFAQTKRCEFAKKFAPTHYSKVAEQANLRRSEQDLNEVAICGFHAKFRNNINFSLKIFFPSNNSVSRVILLDHLAMIHQTTQLSE